MPKTESPPWEAKAKEYEEKIAKLTQDVEWAESTNTSATGGKVAPKKNIDEMTTIEITKQALKVQDKTQESTQRAKRVLDETIEVCSSCITEDWNVSQRRSQTARRKVKRD